MWGIIPAAGAGSRIQPLAFSKELLPVGSRYDGTAERPRAVSEYLVERMIVGGARKLCFVIGPGKSDIMEYYGSRVDSVDIAYVVQPRAAGLCDAIFRALPFIQPDEPVLVGLPDTVWTPADALTGLPDDVLSFLCFPVEHPEFFDAVVADEDGTVREIQVKRLGAESNWIWGAFKMPGSVLHELFQLWNERRRTDEYIGTLVNAWLAQGGRAVAVHAGKAYVDVGTLHGYREAIKLLSGSDGDGSEASVPVLSMKDLTTEEPEAAVSSPAAPSGTPFTPEQIQARIHELGQWFHNINLNGVWTAPDHFLGDYPNLKWKHFAHAIPQDLSGKSVLDIGCNAGFYSIEMKKRGAARVVGIDSDETYLAQARFAAEVLGYDIEFRNLDVYNVARLGEKFDVVIFMGVLYHLRHPLLALELIHEHVARDLFVFQSMQRGSTDLAYIEEDYSFWQTDIFERPDFPRLHFIEKHYSGDPTNWWIPNRACVEAMLRSSGFQILDNPEPEVYICRWTYDESVVPPLLAEAMR